MSLTMAGTTLPAISNVSSGVPGLTSVTITWSTAPLCDSQVEYGETEEYGDSTTLDSIKRPNHSITISGLNANTTYHYRVKSRDAAGNLAVSGDYSFETSSLTDIEILSGVNSPPALSKQTVGSAFYDPTYGSSITRILSGGDYYGDYLVPQYSNLQAWNADQTKILLFAGDGCKIFNASTYALIKDFGAGPQEVRWSPVDADVIYYLKNSDNRLYKYTVSTDNEEVKHTFTGYSFLSESGARWSHQDISVDGRYMAMVGWKTATSHYEVFCYDIVNDTVGTALDVTTRNGNPRPEYINGINWPLISPLGNYVLICWNSVGWEAGRGVEAFDRNMNYVGHVSFGFGHSDCLMDSDGLEYFVVSNHDWSGSLPPPCDGKEFIIKCRIPDAITYSGGVPDWTASEADGGISVLFNLSANDGTFGAHLSARNTQLNGEKNRFIVVSTYNQTADLPWVAFENEALKVYLDSTVAAPHFQRICHTRSDWVTGSYWAQPHATISPDGTKVMFGSNWMAAVPGTPMDPYIADLTLNQSIASYAKYPERYWKKLTTTISGYTGLPGRAYTGAAWDSSSDKLVIFGGGHYTYDGNEVQSLDPDILNWDRDRAPNIPALGSNLLNRVYNGNGVYDSDVPSYIDANLQFDYSGYPATTGPRPWSAHSYQTLAFDNAGNGVYVDNFRRTWFYTLASGWTKLSGGLTGNGAGAYVGASLVYAANAGVFVYYGGLNETWEWNGSVWTYYSSTLRPKCELHQTMAYNPADGCIYLFGGERYSPSHESLNETWKYDPSTHQWTQETISGSSPSGRHGNGCAWDSKNGVMLIWGGYSAGLTTYFSEIQIYNPVRKTWHLISQPATKPVMTYEADYQIFGSMVYDPSRNIFLAIANVNGSGTDNGQTYNNAETWAWRYRR